MRVDEITVEVRSLALGRLGQIDAEYLTDLKITKRYCNIGAWTMTLPADYDMATELAQAGRGITVTGPVGLITSGPMLSANRIQTTDDVEGDWSFIGADDNIFLGDALCFPQPSNTNPGTQNVSHWTYGPAVAETILRQVFTLNIGPGGQASRKPNTQLHLTTDGGLGSVMTVKTRFDRLGQFMANVASYAQIGFDLKQDSTGIGLYIYEPVDRSGEIRMDIDNDLLDEVGYGFSAPTGTRYVVAGQGDGTARTIIAVTDATAATAEADWGRKIEIWKDRRDTNDSTVLTQEGTDGVQTTGRTTVSTRVKPADDTTMVFMRDWFLGDIVSVVIDGQELPAIVTEAIISITADGVAVGATIGDPTGFDYESKIAAKQAAQEERLAFLEKNAEVASIPSLVDVQVFTANGTWTKPAGAKSVHVIAIGAGGGGGSGRRGAAASARGGGGGGGGGAMSVGSVPATALAATVTVTVGTGGPGGTAVAANDTNGTAGTAGGASTFGKHFVASGGGGGGAGGTAAAAAGVGGGSGIYPGGKGGVGSVTGAGAAAKQTEQDVDLVGPRGGGGGGALTTGNVSNAGGAGAVSVGWRDAADVSSAGGAANGGAGGSQAANALYQPGFGGGGGGAGNAAGGAGGAGGAGTQGSGGGGGGPALNGSLSGAGGAGGAGVVVVTTYF